MSCDVFQDQSDIKQAGRSSKAMLDSVLVTPIELNDQTKTLSCMTVLNRDDDGDDNHDDDNGEQEKAIVDDDYDNHDNGKWS